MAHVVLNAFRTTCESKGLAAPDVAQKKAQTRGDKLENEGREGPKLMPNGSRMAPGRPPENTAAWLEKLLVRCWRLLR